MCDTVNRRVVQASKRDGLVCTATRSVLPDVVRHWPSAINNTVTHRNYSRETVKGNTLVFSHDMKKRIVGLLAPLDGELGTSDKAWNMTSIDTQLRRYWDNACFGLRWVGVVETSETNVGGPEGASTEEYASFRAQWHWLPDRVRDALQSHLTQPEGIGGDARMLVDLDSPEALQSIKNALRVSAQKSNLFSTKGGHGKERERAAHRVWVRSNPKDGGEGTWTRSLSLRRSG